MTLPQFHSISKKVCVALLGSFLMFFLLFHACANLCILRHDDGAWYSTLCHFMGSNIFVKILEVILLTVLVCHITLTLWIRFSNRKARPKNYHQRNRSQTHAGSKFQIWSGILILACLFIHFNHFYFVKNGFIQGQYMVKTEQLEHEIQQCNNPRNLMYAKAFLFNAKHSQQMSQDGRWIQQISAKEKDMLQQALPRLEIEPDFYHLAREKFQITHIAILYLLFFVVLWFHLRHGFAAAFQTLGLYNYKYGKAIEVCGILYACLICLMFAGVVILVWCGL